MSDGRYDKQCTTQGANGKLVEPYDFLDSLYRAVTLFGFGGAVNPPIPLSLQIARIVAPVLTGFAATSFPKASASLLSMRNMFPFTMMV